MAYEAKILKDSLSPAGVRLTTMEVSFPRIVLAEFNTHRMFSRNSASSRAIPVEKMLKRVEEDPFEPVWWGKNQKGMQAAEELSDVTDGMYPLSSKPDPGYGYTSPRVRASQQWHLARRNAIDVVKRMQMPDIDLHKQIANRLLEPWLWHTVIVTATEWDNFWGLRCHKDAQPEIRRIAEMMRASYDSSKPAALNYGQWHLPLLQPNEFVLAKDSPEWNEPVPAECHLMTPEYAVKVCVGRCARVSYLTHDGKRDPAADVELAERLRQSGHLSPMEHVAKPMSPDDAEEILRKPGVVGIDRLDVEPRAVFCGNLRGWVSYRKTIPHEDDLSKAVSSVST